MRIKNSLFFVPLILLFVLSACDDEGNNSCVDLLVNNNFLLAFQECPNDGIKQVCNSFNCIFPPPPGSLAPVVLAVINPSDCSRIDRCFNLVCDYRNSLTGEVVGEVFLTTEEILLNNEFVGVGSLGFGDFSCSPILP